MNTRGRVGVVERLEGRVFLSVTFPDGTGFENDTDGYTPNDSNPFNDPPTGAPPANVVDVRNGGSGLAEEIPSGTHGVAASSGSNLGEIYFNDPNNGPYAQFAKAASPAPNPAGTGAPYSFTVDIYTDAGVAPSLGVGGGGAANGSNGIPDFWWTNAVDDRTQPVVPTGYMTESGFTGEVLQGSTGPRVWRFTTTATGNPSFDASVNTWYTLEVKWKSDTSGNLVAEHDIYNQSHTSRLFSYTIPASSIFQGPFTINQLGGPTYSWFVYADANVRASHLSVDNWGVGQPVSVVDNTNPTVDIVDVAPDPRRNGVSSITIQFSEAVVGFGREDLTLTRSGNAVALTTSQPLTSSNGGRTWVLGNLTNLTKSNGTYTLSLNASGAGIADLAGNPLTVGASDSWTTDKHGHFASVLSLSGLSSQSLADELFGGSISALPA